jgi:hypothetical protein
MLDHFTENDDVASFAHCKFVINRLPCFFFTMHRRVDTATPANRTTDTASLSLKK